MLVENRTHAITLSFATHSFGMIITGLLIFLLGTFGIKDEGDIYLESASLDLFLHMQALL